MHHVKSHPPLESALALVRPLERAGVVVALGGSGLLAALGLTEEVRDWDLTLDVTVDHGLRVLWQASHPAKAAGAAPDRQRMLADLGAAYKGSDELHADEKLTFQAHQAELIHHFAFYVKGATVRIPTRISGQWNRLPLGSPEGWMVAYALLGRVEKSERLARWLGLNGADPVRVAELVRQPLPAEIRARLEALARGGGTSSDA